MPPPLSDVSPLLTLPLIQPAQAQKHVTHNTALDRLDQLVQLVVEEFGATTPPVAPAEGAVWALGDLPTGAWAGRARHLASWRGGVWAFAAPSAGWRAWGRAETRLRIFDGGGWGPLLDAADLQNLGGIGIGTLSDATNRLAVQAAATLFSHAGAGHQLKLNKAAPGETASLLLQTGFSGRAEIGLAGTDDLAVKVSADGTLFQTALAVAAGSGLVTAPAGLAVAAGSAAAPGLAFAGDADTGLTRPAADQIGLATGGVQRMLLAAAGLQLDVPLTGSAVQAGPADGTAGRLLKVGAFGLGQTAAGTDTGLNATTVTGLYGYGAGDAQRPGSGGGAFVVLRHGTAGLSQIAWAATGNAAWVRQSADGGATWGGWQRIYMPATLLGAVGLSGGVPTGAVIEAGSNANGHYTRFADGSQICHATEAGTLTCDTAIGSLFAAPAEGSWTFPASFTSSAAVTVGGGVLVNGRWVNARRASSTSAVFRHFSATSSPTAQQTSLWALGRWA